MAQGKNYSAVGKEFLAKAQEALAQGDLAQASEKGWGAAAQMVKAVAERRGWPHNGHASLFQAVRRLVDETGDDRLDLLFHVANSLHVNFYEHWLPEASVASGLEAVTEFIKRLEELIVSS